MKAGIAVTFLGALIFIASFIASGIQYRISETAGEVTDTPAWIVIWHGVGLAATIVGLVVFGSALILEARKKRQI